MKPIKIRLSKRSHTDDETDTVFTLKRKIKEIIEKENEEAEQKNAKTPSKLKRSGQVLEDSPLPSKRANIKKSRNEDNLSDDEDDEFDEMFLQLKARGVKTVRSSTKKSPKSATKEHEETKTPKQESEIQYFSSVKLRSRKKLDEEFDSEKNCATINKKKLSSEKKSSDLEKLSEDSVLNCKRTSVKRVSLNFEETPKKDKGVETPLRRSTRRKSYVLSSEIIFEDDIFHTPKKTPRKKFSLDNAREPKTPTTKTKGSTPSTPLEKVRLREPRTPITKSKESTPSTPLEKARLSLHVSTVPECLPCREKEYNDILTFLKNKLWDGIGGCMYISGVPGTGKTATVTQVIRFLQNQAEEGKIPEFKYIDINGMRLSDPRQAYVELWKKLFDKKEKITSDRAQALLDSWFSKSDKKNTKKTTVLLVDELDLICTKKQDVVYNLLDWPTRTHSRLVVLTIANTMDMPERLFKGRVTSRMGLTRLTFMPYTHKQLEEIILARLNGLNAFITDAVRLVTRKVAAVSGDARRALEICRRATELPAPDETVKICHIEQAIREMTNSNIVKVIRNCGKMEKLFLRSLSDVSFRSNVDEVDLREVIDQLLAICVLEGITRPSISSILTVSNRLKCCRLIFTNQSSAGILQRLTLNVTQDDIHYALNT